MNKKSVLLWIALIAGMFAIQLMIPKLFSEDATEPSAPARISFYGELQIAPVDSIILVEYNKKWRPVAVVESSNSEYVTLIVYDLNDDDVVMSQKNRVGSSKELSAAVWNMPARLVNVLDSDYPSVRCEFVMMTSHISKARACPEEKQEEELPQQTNPSVSSEALG